MRPPLAHMQGMKTFARPFLATIFALAALWSGPLAAAAPPSGGTISLEPKTADGDYDPALPSFVAAATEALAARGFTILDTNHAAYVGELILSRVDVGTGSAKVAAGHSTATPGGVGGSVGAGITIPLSTGKSRLVAIQRTRLELRIRKRGEHAIVWDAAAVTVRPAGTRRGADELVASDLSAALLQTYPVQPTAVVGVP